MIKMAVEDAQNFAGPQGKIHFWAARVLLKCVDYHTKV
jgi:hypothetical protein